MMRLVIVSATSSVVLLVFQIAFVHRWMNKYYLPDTLIRDIRQFREDDKRFLRYVHTLRKENYVPSHEMELFFQNYGSAANQYRGGVFLFKIEVIFNTIFNSLLMGIVAAFPSVISQFISKICLALFSVSVEIPPLSFILVSYPFIIGELFYTFLKKWNNENCQNLTILLDGYIAFLNGFEMCLENSIKSFSKSSDGVKISNKLYLALRILTYLLAITATIPFIYNSFLSFVYVQTRPSISGLLYFYVSSPWNLLSIFCAIMAFGCFKFQEFLFGGDYNSPEGSFRERFHEWRSFHRRTLPVLKGILSPWEQDCLTMCKALHVYNVSVELEANGTHIAYTNRLKSGKVTVYFNSAYIQKWKSKSDYYDIIKFILAHELAHASAGDLVNRSERISACICLFFWVFPLILGGYFRSNFCALLLLIMYMIVFKNLVIDIFTDNRFWGQIKELRADRIGMLVSGVSLDSFRHSVLLEEELQFGARIMAQQSSKTEIEPDAHPSSVTRINELEKHHNLPWSLVDYFRYALQYWRKLRFSNEWKL